MRSSCRRTVSASVFALWATSLLCPLSALSQSTPDQLIFGARQYLRTTGAPNQYTDTFTVPTSIGAPFLLHIVNGDASGSHRISSATVTINNVQVAGPKDFNQNVAVVDRTITLQPSNTMHVEVSSKPGSYLTLSVFGATTGAATSGPLTQARVGHTATLLASGKVLLAGGSGPGGVLDTAELFDPVTLSATALTSSLTTARTEHTATLLPQTETLLIAGQDNLGLLFSTEMFNPGNQTFRALSPNAQVLRSGHTATLLLDGRVLITGGQSSGALSSVEGFNAQTVVVFKPAYDPEAGTFLVLPNGLVTPRWDHTATLLADGRILITGGSNDTGILASAEVFDPATEKITALTGALTTPRAGHTATLLPDGRVLLLGGEGPSGVLATAEVFTPATNSFSAVTSRLATPRVNHTETLLPTGLVLITGGQNSAGILASTELYTPTPADTTASLVNQVTPPNGATGVDQTQIIGMRFSEPVDVRTLTSTSVTLSNGGAVAATISPGEQGLMLFVVPSAPLAAGTTYTLSLTAAITDTSGHPLSAFASQFTTVAAPTITGFSPSSGPAGTVVTITGTNFDPVASQNEVRFNGVTATVTSASATSLTAIVSSGATTGPISVTTRGGTATSATNFTVIASPVITGFTPTSGPIGTAVTIFGQNFDAVPTNNQVRFSGTAAVIASATTTSIATTVPQGATTGPITVTTPTGTATSSAPFTVALSADFQIATAPLAVTAVQGQAAFALLQLSGTPGFANLVNLAVGGLTTGVTAKLSAPVLSTAQTVTLTLTTSATTPAGPIPLTVTGSTTIDGQTVTRTATLQFSVLAAGTTTFAGRVLRAQDEVPLEGVTLTLAVQTTRTDAAGRFLFTTAPGGTQIMTIDGSTVTNPPGVYHTLPAQVTILDGQANEMPFVSYLPQVDTSVVSTLDSTKTSVIQDPRVPGLSFTVPAGVTLRSDVDGSLITQVAITPVTPDRIPLPAPGPTFQHIDPRTIYLMYFFKPGGAIPSQPVTQFSLPNDLGAKPGAKVEFYYFDSSPTATTGSNQWKKAGTGTVTGDGLRLIPDSGTAFPKFCCALIFGCNVQPPDTNGPAPDDSPDQTVADPVDPATGQLVVTKTDYVMAGRMPLVIRRGYQSTRILIPGPFGMGTTFNYETEVQPVELAGLTGAFSYSQPSGRIDFFSSQPDGTYQNTTLPFLRGVVLTLNADGTRTLRKKDRSLEQYNSNGRLIAVQDRNGNTITIQRDSADHILYIADPGGRALHFTYDGGRIGTITDPIRRVVTYTYNAAGDLETVTDAAGGVTRYTYDANGLLLTITDPRGLLYLQNQYDSMKRVVKQTLADGGVYSLTYQGFGNTITQTTITDPQGNTQTRRFTSTLYSAARTDALGQRTKHTYDSVTNFWRSTTDSLGQITRFAYDPNGNITTIADPASNTTNFTYEPTFNRVTSITDALNRLTSFTYDAKGNLKTTTDPLNHATSVTYNTNGQPANVTDALGNITTFEYDAQGNLITTADPLGNRTTRTYDAVSRLIAITDPRGFTTQFSYDALNRVTQITDATGGVTAFTYDPNGNLLTVTDPRGKTTTFTYDTMDRLLTRTDALGRTESYTYNLAGNRIKVTNRKGQVTTYTYDALNRRTVASYADGSSVSFVYDTLGRASSANDSVAGLIQFFYDSLGRLIQEVTPQGNITYAYDAIGRRTTMTVSGQQPVSYGYDAASRLVQVQQGTLMIGLAHDANGRRTSLSYPNGTNTSYTYDAASRMTNIAYQGPGGLIDSVSYAYDANGNRISVTRLNAPVKDLPMAVQAAYDAANEQVQFNSSSPNLTYDANGNLTGQTDLSSATTYTWDARNRLTAISGPGLTASFIYDALGRRVAKTINGVTTMHLYDGNDIVQEVRNGTVNANYLRSLNLDVPFVRQSSINEYYHLDALGSVLALTDQAGVVQISYNYEAFGNTTTVGTSANPFQYTGRENDGTGLYYYRARYQSPIFRRFMSEDPVGFRGGDANLYAYVRNRPIGLRDPLGLWDPDFHEGMTREEATACGMSDEDADALAKAVRGVDFLWVEPIPSPSTLNPWSAKHGMPGTKWQSYSAGQLSAAASAAHPLQPLAQGLHALQDGYAHDLADAGMLDHLAPLVGGVNPDDPTADENVARADAARAATRNAIRDFMKARGLKQKCAQAGE